ncbi:hypothetical protein B296_00028823 [Ensete ventricosum]|uniref:Uncharacterized protein n=1 Tax=Ensete ventricosum TaxID=4639 RepID=A0A427AMG1_ENSVE|nr:hypothetical protein B296_00028823 [Ensete ventricosum]
MYRIARLKPSRLRSSEAEAEEQGATCPTQRLVVGVRRREPHGLPQPVRRSSLRSAPRRRVVLLVLTVQCIMDFVQCKL